MKIILVIMGRRDDINLAKLEEAVKNYKKNDKVIVSGIPSVCNSARFILGKLKIKQDMILSDIKSRGTLNFLKEYINGYDNLLLISENQLEEILIRKMYKRKLSIKNIRG